MLPFLRFGVIGNQEGVVAVREVIDAQIQPMLRPGGGPLQIQAGISPCGSMTMVSTHPVKAIISDRAQTIIIRFIPKIKVTIYKPQKTKKYVIKTRYFAGGAFVISLQKLY